MTDNLNETLRFRYIFWFVVVTNVLSMSYAVAVSFFSVPKDNQQTVSIILGVLLGTVITGGVNFLIGGSPAPPKKSDSLPGTATVDISATATTDPSKT